MNNYAIYNATTGQILRIVKCASTQAAAQLSAGEALLECSEGVTDLTHHVVDGVIVPV